MQFCGKRVGISRAGTISSSPEPPEQPASLRSRDAWSLNGLRMPPPPGLCCSAISPGHKPERVQGQAGNVCECRDQGGTGEMGRSCRAETQLMGSVLKVLKRILCGMSQEKVRSWIFMCCLCWQLFNL